MSMPDFNHPECEAVGICFAEHLTFYLLTGQLGAGRRDTRDWLRLLMKDELEKLATVLELFLQQDEPAHPDLPELLLLLVFLETGNRQPAIKLDDVADMLEWLLAICKLEFYARQGYIKLEGKWRITEPKDENHYAGLTEKGVRAADEPGAPQFLRWLKQRTGSAEWN